MVALLGKLYIYTDENFCSVVWRLPVASLDRDTRRRIGDCDLVGSDSEATLRTGNRRNQVNLDCDRTLLHSGDTFGGCCRLFRLWPAQRQSSLLGVDSANSISTDEDDPVDTNYRSRRPELAHSIGALLHRNASALSRRKYHHTVLHDPVVCNRGTFGLGQCVSLPAPTAPAGS